jgi:hypothetical protein
MAVTVQEELEATPCRSALAILLASSLNVAALAQTPPPAPAPIPLSGSSIRRLSNLADAIQTFDTFLGTDSAGPYLLGWKEIPAQGVEVYIDGRPLLAAQYTLDTAKGELTFLQPVKRTQMVRVSYGYYPGQAQRNANPAASAPLMASVGKLQVLALSSPTDGGRKMVWGLGEKGQLFGGSFISQFYFAPESLDGQTREAGSFGKAGVKLGYNVGNAENGLDASFLRSGRDFGGYGKQVGIAEATQNLSLAGRFNPSKSTGLSFSQTDNRDLTGKPGVFAQNLAARIGGLGFSQTIDDKPDAKGKRVRVETEKTTLTTALGGLKVAASDGATRTLGADGKTVGADTSVLDLRLAPKGKPALGFNRTENGTIDAAGKRSAVTTEKTDLSGALGRAGFTANLTSVLAVGADKKRTEDETKSLGVSLAEKNKPTVSYLRSENEKTDAAGAKTTTISDRGELIGKFAGASVTAKTLQSRSLLPGGKEAGVEQNTLGLALGPTSILRTEDLKSDGKSAHGIVTDKFDTKKRVGRADVTVASLSVATTTPDQKKTTAETQRVDVKLPDGVSVTRLTDEKVDPTGAKTAIETQKADLTGKVGSAALTASTTQINTTTPDPKTTGTSQETTIALTGSGATKGTGATVALTGGAGQTGAGTEQKQGVSVKLQPTPAVSFSAEQKDQIVTPGTGAPKVISTQGATAELRPMAGTVLTGAWRMSLDGTSELSVTEYAAQLGKDRGAFQFHGGMVNRASTAGGLGALDSARANLKLRPAPGLLLTTNYTLNPEEKGVITPLTRREFGLEAKSGSLELGGAYASTELSLLSPEALRQQAGALEYGEYTLSVGLRFSPTARLTTLLKDSFYTGAPKGLRSFGLGFSHSAGDAFLQLSGTMTTNRALVGAGRNDVKAEAKFGVKF